MCTLTWHDTTDGYRVFFNRDERRERKPGVPPAVLRRGDTRFIAPLDGDFGGTWIAVNEHGLTVCLLNGFPPADADARDAAVDYVTRGSVPLSVIEHGSIPGISSSLQSAALGRFRPFVLVAFAPGGGGWIASWSGRALATSEGRAPAPPLVSSSFYTEEVRSSRVAVYRELCGAASANETQAHLAYHASHLPARGPHSPCMHRPDASTVSFCRIDVGERDVRFHYTPRSPCRGLPPEPAAVLPRRGVSGGARSA